MDTFNHEEINIIIHNLNNKPFSFSNGYFGINYPFLSLEMVKNIELYNKTLKLKFEKSIKVPPKLHFKYFEPPATPTIQYSSVLATLEFESNISESIVDSSTINKQKEEHFLLIEFLPFKSLIIQHESYFEECFNLWYQTKVIPLLKRINQQILIDFSDGNYQLDYFFKLVNQLLPEYRL